MSQDHENFAERRGILSAQIARQRGELAEAYRNIEKPIHYAEYGMRGFGFLRKNPWVFVTSSPRRQTSGVHAIIRSFGPAETKQALKPPLWPSQRHKRDVEAGCRRGPRASSSMLMKVGRPRLAAL